jgi:hypothetical protein
MSFEFAERFWFFANDNADQPRERFSVRVLVRLTAPARFTSRVRVTTKRSAA